VAVTWLADQLAVWQVPGSPVRPWPQTTLRHPVVFHAAASVVVQLYLYPAVHIFSRSLFQVFFVRPLPLWSGRISAACEKST